MSNLFAKREELEAVPLVDHLVVDPVTYDGREMFAVSWFTGGLPVARYDSKVAAWDHACRVPFNQKGTLPKIGPGGLFLSRNKGPKGGRSWTSDPRFAEHVLARDVDDETLESVDAAIINFIRHQLGEVADDEAFHEMPGENTPERLSELAQTPLETPDNPSESLAGDERATTPPENPEPSGAFSEVHNFLDLAENAPSERARAYWLARWEDVRDALDRARIIAG